MSSGSDEMEGEIHFPTETVRASLMRKQSKRRSNRSTCYFLTLSVLLLLLVFFFGAWTFSVILRNPNPVVFIQSAPQGVTANDQTTTTPVQTTNDRPTEVADQTPTDTVDPSDEDNQTTEEPHQRYDMDHVLSIASKMEALTKTMTKENKKQVREKGYALVQENFGESKNLPGPIRVEVAELNYQYQMNVDLAECTRVDQMWGIYTAVAHCDTVTRLGLIGEGGKVVCGVEKLKRGNCRAYSFGSADEVEFDRNVRDIFGCEVHSFDCTIPPDRFTEEMNFHPLCLGPTSAGFKLGDNPAPHLGDIMKQLNHDRLDILKIDIESSEFHVLPYMATEMPTYLRDVGVISFMVEMHEINDCSQLYRLRKNVEDIHAMGYYMFSLEDNYLCPPCAEASFVSRDYLYSL